MENSQLKQLALLYLSILNFSIMRADRGEDAPLRVDSCAVPDGFLLVRLISGVNRRLEFEKRSQLSSARTTKSFPSRDAVIRIYDNAGNVVDAHTHKDDFKEP